MKKFEDLIKPFKFTPKTTISGGHNGKTFYFLKDQEVELTFEEYITILYSQYGDQLWN